MNESKDQKPGYDKCVCLQGSEGAKHEVHEFFDVWSAITIKHQIPTFRCSKAVRNIMSDFKEPAPYIYALPGNLV